MTDLQDLILHRRSIRKFKDRLLTFEEKRAILCSALVAPSSKNRRPCRFVLVEDREMINKLIRCKLIGTLPLETATWVLVVVADPTQSEAWIEDASIAAAFAQLQAEDLGLGSCWVQVRGRDYDEETSSSEYIKKLLEIPSQMEVECLLAFGEKDEERKPYSAEKLQIDKIHLNKWQHRPAWIEKTMTY